jgi:hypothetical protein
VITARLVGDDAVLAWLRAIPDLVSSGLARAITTLGIELQRKIQEGELANQTLAPRSGSLSSSLQIDQSDDRIAATVSSGSDYTHAHEYGFGAAGVGASLRHVKKAFRRPIPRKAISLQSYHSRIEVPEPSFLHSALEDMDPAIRDEVEAALREALTL